MAHLALKISYDGTEFHGFQAQAESLSIQSTLESHMRALVGPGNIIGASRTDSGVHADEQIVVWTGSSVIPLDRLGWVLNRRLPVTIRIHNLAWAPTGWDPRRVVAAKFYRYQIWRGPVPASWARFVHRVDEPLGWQRLQEAARLFEGVHDFAGFRSEGSSAKTTRRDVYTSHWEMAYEGRLWIYRVGANGFLYHMVRHLVAAMMDAAKTGSLRAINAALESPGVATKVKKLAPASGLTLERIDIRPESWHQLSNGEEDERCFGKWY
jgi:tRNA pseudouridine38-40 synthase